MRVKKTSKSDRDCQCKCAFSSPTMTMLLKSLVIISAVAAATAAQTACQDEASCEAAASLLPDLPSFRVLATQTKGCFEKGGTVYWSSGGTPEENSKDAPGQQVRIYCDDGIDEDAEATTTFATATGVQSTEGSVGATATGVQSTEGSVEATISSSITVAATEAAAEVGSSDENPFELTVEVDEVVAVGEPVLGDEEGDVGAAPPAKEPAPSTRSAADGRPSRFSANCLVLGSLWLSLAVLYC